MNLWFVPLFVGWVWLFLLTYRAIYPRHCGRRMYRMTNDERDGLLVLRGLGVGWRGKIHQCPTCGHLRVRVRFRKG